MVVRAVVGFTVLVGLVYLGAWMGRQRGSGRPVVRRLAGEVHRIVGVVAVAVLVMLTITALRLLG